MKEPVNTYNFGRISSRMETSPRRPMDELITNNPCRRLTSGDHFHADLYGRYIPPGCTGIALPLEEAVNGIPTGKYPCFETLYKSGIAGLLRYAAGRGFAPDPSGYPSACALCFYIRHWLVDNAASPELDAEHYAASLTSIQDVHKERTALNRLRDKVSDGRLSTENYVAQKQIDKELEG